MSQKSSLIKTPQYVPGALTSDMRGYRRMVSEALPANVQVYFDKVTALPSYAATVKADVATSERLKG